jgi:hypothetical protein
MFIPDPASGFFPSRIPDPHQRILYLKILFFKLSEICSGLFIPDPDPDFLPIPDRGVIKSPDPGSGSARMLRRVSIDYLIWRENWSFDYVCPCVNACTALGRLMSRMWRWMLELPLVSISSCFASSPYFGFLNHISRCFDDAEISFTSV